MLRNINLQLFAEDEIDEVEIKEEVEEEIEVETEEEVEEEVKEEPKKDSEKMVPLKALHEARAKIKRLEAEKEERERTKADSSLKQKLLEDGLSEEEADDRITDRRERQELKTELKRLKYSKEADKLEARYPDIQEHLDSFISIVEASKGAITLSELCRAKLDKSSEFEKKTKLEQETLLKKQKAKGKAPVSNDTSMQPVKLDDTDERAYQIYAKKNPSVSRKQYQEILNGPEQKIPHDKWD